MRIRSYNVLELLNYIPEAWSALAQQAHLVFVVGRKLRYARQDHRLLLFGIA